jgi:hypothetical protein
VVFRYSRICGTHRRAAGQLGNVSAGRRIGVWGTKTAFRYAYNDRPDEVDDALQTPTRRYADTPIPFPARAESFLALCWRARPIRFPNYSRFFHPLKEILILVHLNGRKP